MMHLWVIFIGELIVQIFDIIFAQFFDIYIKFNIYIKWLLGSFLSESF